MGAMEGVGCPEWGSEGVDWAFSNPMALGNMGNGWQSFPEDARNMGYNKEPEGSLTFAQQQDQPDFRNPAGAHQEPPLES